MRAAGMAPVRLRKEIAGFVFNRLQGAVLREAYCLVRDGVVAPEDIDLVMRAGLGRRWSVLGPFETVELNTRGGIDAHATIMGPAYARMGAERGQTGTWEPELVSQVSASVGRRLPRAGWEEHVAWRDRALMTLERCWREHPELSGPARTEPARPAADPAP
jgi:L-gulonate 3-dehydrogenase